MLYILLALAVFGLVTSSVFTGMVLAALPRFFRERREALAALDLEPRYCPPMSLLKPLHGAEPGLESYLTTFFEQVYPVYEILFCTKSADDVGLAIARRVAARYPEVPVQFLSTGGQPDHINAKVAQMELMEKHATDDIFVISDSDVRVKPNYLQSLITKMRSE